MKSVYITSTGSYLPNEGISNAQMEDYLGRIRGKDSPLKERILKQNGIQNRHYAIDKNQNTTHLNQDLAIAAIKAALKDSTLRESDIELLMTGTTQGDLPVPGFASLVHSGLDMKRCEIANFQSVCASGIMALKNAYHQIQAGAVRNAVCVGSELSSRMFKSSRFEAQGVDSLPFDAEFLRWMLSDGAGAFVLQDQPAAQGLSLEIEWMDLRSYANEFELCMYTGKTDNKNERDKTWLDYASYEEASAAGAINLQQDVRLVKEVVKMGVAHYFDLIDQGKFEVNDIDWLCAHYSSEVFKAPIKELMEKGGGTIPEDRWYSNLKTKGNTGAASIFIMLDELFRSGRLQAGDQILCMIPESGRFITSFMLLKVHDGSQAPNTAVTKHEIAAPELELKPSEISEWLVRQLTQVWIDFETELMQVPIVRKIHDHKLSIEDYKLLLRDLRQQVIDGSQWISRAASHIDIELFELRSAFIRHTATEHRDFLLLEKNYAALGADIDEMHRGQKNIGSMALSAFMFQQASKPNPLDLLGSMFIIEGIGKRLAGDWGRMMQEQLSLEEDQVSFFTYHGVADEDHFHHLEQALDDPRLNMEIAARIAKTAKTTAKLYNMQLLELGNY